MEGNREFFLHLRTDAARALGPAALEELLARTAQA
jgi:hypothetical protein